MKMSEAIICPQCQAEGKSSPGKIIGHAGDGRAIYKCQRFRCKAIWKAEKGKDGESLQK